MKKEKPYVDIEGERYLVNVKLNRLEHSRHQYKRLSICDMKYAKEGYTFYIEKATKSIVNDRIVFNQKDHTFVSIPHLCKLDPHGVAKKYRYTPEQMEGKTDFDLMPDLQGLFYRQNGALPQVEIEGQNFYVDYRMRCLRPQDNFHTNGIQFDELEYYFDDQQDRFIFPYDKKKLDIASIDIDTVTVIPSNVVIVTLPCLQALDPIGYSRATGFDREEILRETPQNQKTIAGQISWEKSGIYAVIEENKKKLGIVESSINDTPTQKEKSVKRKM